MESWLPSSSINPSIQLAYQKLDRGSVARGDLEQSHRAGWVALLLPDEHERSGQTINRPLSPLWARRGLASHAAEQKRHQRVGQRPQAEVLAPGLNVAFCCHLLSHRESRGLSLIWSVNLVGRFLDSRARFATEASISVVRFFRTPPSPFRKGAVWENSYCGQIRPLK